MSQLPLPLAPRWNPLQSAFVAGPANAAARAAVAGWRGWPGGRLALVGPEASGKSHLAHLWAAEAGARLIPAARLAGAPQDLADRPLALEDADRSLPAGGEEALFHLLNAFAAAGRPLLLTGRTPPARWGVRLPDLASRLAAIAVSSLGAPDDDLLAAILARQLSDRGLSASPEMMRYLTLRMDRSAAAAVALAARLDAAALAERAPLTVPFARRVLGW